MINIRKAGPDDAASLFTFVSDLDSQSEYLLYSQGERINDISMTKVYLEKIEDNKKSVVIIAETERGKIVGFLCGETSRVKRISHVMKVNIGVLKEYRGSSISRELGRALFEHVNRVGIQRVEASIIRNNKISLNLCKKFGFEIEGVKKCSIKIGDMLYDEYFLSRLFV